MTSLKDEADKGAAIRREVLGGDYVDATAPAAWSFAQPFRDLINGAVWGAIWGRPGLSRRDRSLLTLGMLSALGADELEVHIRGAVNNGLTPEELREVFIQVGGYCGAPAGLAGFRRLRKVLDEMGIKVDEAGE
jgi:4-carboxymuconolactone decarboxylase